MCNPLLIELGNITKPALLQFEELFSCYHFSSFARTDHLLSDIFYKQVILNLYGFFSFWLILFGDGWYNLLLIK